MRFVPDTNVLLSAAISQGLCFEIITDGLKNRQVCLSDYILDELQRILPDKSKFTVVEAARIVAYFRIPGTVELVFPAEVPTNACSDQKDLPILGTAIAAKTDFIISGDQHLLDLKEYRGIKILSPRAFFEVSRQQKPI